MPLRDLRGHEFNCCFDTDVGVYFDGCTRGGHRSRGVESRCAGPRQGRLNTLHASRRRGQSLLAPVRSELTGGGTSVRAAFC